MTHKSLPCLFVIWFNSVCFHMCDYPIENFLILRNSQGTISVFYDGVGPSCIKPCNNTSFFIFPDRKLRFVSVMIRFIHSNDRLHRKLCKAADSLQVPAHLFFFKSKLLLIRKCLKLTAAALTGKCTLWLHSVWRRF